MLSLGKRSTVLVLLVVVLWQTGFSGDIPRRVILNLTAAPATSMAVTWRTQAYHADPKVEIAEATPGPTFALSRKASRRDRYAAADRRA